MAYLEYHLKHVKYKCVSICQGHWMVDCLFNCLLPAFFSPLNSKKKSKCTKNNEKNQIACGYKPSVVKKHQAPSVCLGVLLLMILYSHITKSYNFFY